MKVQKKKVNDTIEEAKEVVAKKVMVVVTEQRVSVNLREQNRRMVTPLIPNQGPLKSIQLHRQDLNLSNGKGEHLSPCSNNYNGTSDLTHLPDRLCTR